MVKIEKISKHKLLDLIKHSYEGDKDLFEKYHVIKGDAETLAIETMDMIDKAAGTFDLSYYKVIFNKEPIGYFVTANNILYSFAINKKYRTKEILINWWKHIKMVLGKAFTVTLYENNERAINFLIKNGMEVFSKQGNLVLLINYQ